MTVDPASRNGLVPTFEISAEGTRVDDTIVVESIRTWNAVNEIPHAEIVMASGSGRRGGDFAVSNRKTFVPGNEVVISAGYGSKTEPIFSGIIAGHGISLDPVSGPVLVVRLVHEAAKMTLARTSATFENMSDGDVVERLIEAAGLSANLSVGGAPHGQVVQHDATDWDMLIARSRSNGWFVTASGAAITVAPPDTKRKPDLRVTYGTSMLDFDADLDSLSQLAPKAIRARAWDIAGQQVVERGAGQSAIGEAGNVSSKRLAEAFAVDPFVLQSGAPLANESLQQMAAATLQSSALAKIQGTVTFAGSAEANPATMIELAGLSARFNGSVFVSAVHHVLERGEWRTTCELGVPADWLAEEFGRDGSEPLPPTRGLQIGVVNATGQDPTGQFRVQVELPLASSGSPVWMRLASFYATAGVGGAVFFPEIGDEVVVGFMDDDPSYGVVLGSLFSASHPPKYEPEPENPTKAIVTRSGLEIRFDDDRQVIAIETPNGNRLSLDDDDRSVVIEDENGNRVVLSDDGMKLESGGDIEISAGRDIIISANRNVTIDAEARVEVEGSAGAELSTSGTAVVKGSLVQIN